jgi:YVTN family beta-propeller protein
VIDTAGNTVVATVTVGSTPLGVAITPNGASAYVTNNGSDSISVINTGTNTVPATVTVPTPSNPYGVAITPAASCPVTDGEDGEGDEHEQRSDGHHLEEGNGGHDGHSHSCKSSGKED